jgi:arylsulfatase A-like enzyme
MAARGACVLVWWAVVCLVAACGSPQPNLVLVVVDTLRADHLGSHGHPRPTSPHLDALAQDGVRFTRVWSTSPWTMPSVASILTGQHGSRHGVVYGPSPLSGSASTLAERLSAAGYRTGAVVSHILLQAKYGFGRGFDVFESRSGSADSHTGGNVTRAAVVQIEQLAGAREPFCLFVHYFDAHYPYRDHPDYAFAPRRSGRLRAGMQFPELLELRGELSPEEIEYLRALYDEEIRYTDEQIGTLLGALADAGVRDHTVIAVTADHGEEFMEHGWLGHTTLLHDTLVRVPLLIRPPGHARGAVVVDAPVSLVALAPTLLELVGVPAAPADFDGASIAALVRGGDGGGDPILADVDYREHTSLRASQRMVVVHPHKLIEDRLTGRVSLFDLAADPRETRDLSADRPDLVAALRARLGAGGAPDSAAPAGELSDRERSRLRELGYVE